MRPIFLTAALAALLLSSTAQAASGPIRSIKISAGGVAEVTRAAEVDDSGPIEITVPLAQVDDILKSLVVLSDKASVKDMSLAGPQSIQETFETLPFKPEDLGSLPRIIGALKGAKVVIDGHSDVRTVMGVEDTDGRGGWMVVLLTSTGEVTRVRLEEATRVRFVDAVVQKQIDDAVALLASAASDRMRTVGIRLARGGVSDVSLSYVVAAPVWKPTYKLVVGKDGKARLQAWAVLENASGEDWNGVSITLSSGRPVTLKQKLHERFWKSRDEVVSSEEPDLQLKQAHSARSLEAHADVGIATAMAVPSPAGMAQMSETASPAVADEVLAMSNFVLPGEFSVRNGETLSVPIIDKVVEAEFVALVAPGEKHPKAALLISNDAATTLPAGIMTVYDEAGGYVGDARFSDMAAGSRRSAVFGTDLTIEQRADRREAETVTSVKLDDWKLVASKTSSIVDTWQVKAGDKSRTVIVEDVVPEGYRIAPGQVVEETATGVRIKAALKAGEAATLTIRYESETQEEMVAASPDIDRIGLWISGTTSKEVRVRLEEVLAATSELSGALSRMEQNSSRYAEIEREQNRIRENLRGIDEAGLKERWIRKMTSLEDEIDALAAARRELETSIEKLRGKLGEKIRAF